MQRVYFLRGWIANEQQQAIRKQTNTRLKLVASKQYVLLLQLFELSAVTYWVP